MPSTGKNRFDIHHPKLMERFGASLRERMGAHLFDQRVASERTINPAHPLTYTKCLNWLSHNGSYLLIAVALSFLGQRRKAVENCWKPELRANKPRQYKKLQSNLHILHLSDLHLDTNPTQVETWINLIKNSSYDFCVITGDFFNAYQIPNAELKAALNKLTQSIHQPIYGILGNHDLLMTAPIAEEAGIRILMNESEELKIRNQNILITGIDDPHAFGTHDIERATQPATVSANHFDAKIALAHSPKDIERFSKLNYDLFLCGHTHGGQLCTKNGHPLVKNGPYPVERISGNWKHESMAGYTSRGTGTGKLSFRLNCPPEIVIHNLC